MRQLRREVEALGAALADMRAQRGDAGAGNPGARNPGFTGALAGLVPGSAGLLGGGFDRGRLLVGSAHPSINFSHGSMHASSHCLERSRGRHMFCTQ